MALMSCVECNGKVSDKAEFCPHCGCPIDEIIKLNIVPVVNKNNINSLIYVLKNLIILKKNNEQLDCEKIINVKLNIGDYVQMGSYYGEPILWRCVDIDENGPLMLSDKILTIKPFDAMGKHTYLNGKPQADKDKNRYKYGSNLWETSNIRAWLNSTSTEGNIIWKDGCPPIESKVYSGYNDYAVEKGFMANGNFNDCERSVIKSVTQKSLINSVDVLNIVVGGTDWHTYNISISTVVQNYDTAYYHNVTDKMFLLDVKQVYKVYQNLGVSYYIGKLTQKAVDYSQFNHSSLLDGENWSYWLSSPDAYNNSYDVRYVFTDGSIRAHNACNGILGVRPAFYINLKTGIFKVGIGTETNPFRVEHVLINQKSKEELLKEKFMEYYDIKTDFDVMEENCDFGIEDCSHNENYHNYQDNYDTDNSGADENSFEYYCGDDESYD